MLEYLINSVISDCEKTLPKEEIKAIICSIKKILPNYEYTYTDSKIDIDEFLRITSGLEEKNKERKKMGMYYTPKDLCSFMTSKMVGENRNNLLNKNILEPTCGNSEFLLSYFNCICSNNHLAEDEKIIDLVRNIYGNDINCKALIISKIRFLFNIFNKLKNKNKIIAVPDILNENFYNIDAVNDLETINQKFDYIIGNPPYVETNSYPNPVNEKFGNIYANILKNSISLLKEDGVLAFVIPISYTSTPRMKKIREYIISNTKEQILYNFSDRPDSLFPSVHQKSTVLIVKNGIEKDHKIFSSGYKYWYKAEREKMFKNIKTILAEDFKDFIPKLENKIEKDIFYKVLRKEDENSLYDCLENKNNEIGSKNDEIHINMRATFWIKCFMSSAKSNEYKTYNLSKKKYYIYCLLNSTLFFFYWTVISDCWHITSKEFKNFKLIIPEDCNLFKNLAIKLDNKLEITKKYIGSKQVEYEYKHKECKDVIDEIDDFIGKVYSLTPEEIAYIKNYNEKYRLSIGE